MYQPLLDTTSSTANNLEFCIGTIAQMAEGDIYEVVDLYNRQHTISNVRLRNVRDAMPSCQETFIDEGDAGVMKVLRILTQNHYDRGHYSRSCPPDGLRCPLACR